VEEVRALPEIPESIYMSAAPSEELPRLAGHRSTWGSLVVAPREFNSTHALADVVRDVLGFSTANLPDGAPPFATVYRNWRAVIADERINRLRRPLKLAYAPGLGDSAPSPGFEFDLIALVLSVGEEVATVPGRREAAVERSALRSLLWGAGDHGTARVTNTSRRGEALGTLVEGSARFLDDRIDRLEAIAW
jgi:hypothetical protein